MDKKTYLENFGCWADVVHQFDLDEATNPEPEMIWAYYEYESYEGDSSVIYRKDGKWYAVYGSHCSCYGLEGQWQPEEFDPNLYFEGLKEDRYIFTPPYYKEEKEMMNEWLKWAKDQ